jgi:hypothetical protein
MPVEPSFEFGEERCFEGRYSWRLKDGELRYRGDGHFANLILRRIPVTTDQIERFVAALDLLDVWSWRDNYDPEDLGMMVLDGGSWWFRAKLAGREIHTAGSNAYPSYTNPKETAPILCEERFAMLRASLYEAFTIDTYLRQAKMHSQAASTSEPDKDSKSDKSAGTET